MPIATNHSFDTSNQKLVKHPLYALTIEGSVEMLTTFRLEDLQVVLTGYGVSGYGMTGYGF